MQQSKLLQNLKNERKKQYELRLSFYLIFHCTGQAWRSTTLFTSMYNVLSSEITGVGEYTCAISEVEPMMGEDYIVFVPA